MKLLLFCCLLLALAVCHGNVIPLATPVPGLLPVAGSHQFVARNYNGVYVPTATTTVTAWPGLSTYPSTYYKYSGGYPSYGYPSYGYPYSYPYGYYPSYNYGYGYKSIW